MISIELLLIIVGIVLTVLVVLIHRMRQPKLSNNQQILIRTHWHDLLQEPDLRQQILGADALLDKVRRLAGYRDGSLGSMLKAHPHLFSSLDALWQAHKLRNTIAHSVGYAPSPKETTKALAAFQQALEDLGCPL